MKRTQYSNFVYSITNTKVRRQKRKPKTEFCKDSTIFRCRGLTAMTPPPFLCHVSIASICALWLFSFWHTQNSLLDPINCKMTALMALKFQRLWLPVRVEAESIAIEVNLSQLYLDSKIIYNWATIPWIAKNEILDCDRILRFWKWPFRLLWASGWYVEAPRAWVGACPRLQTKNLSVGR